MIHAGGYATIVDPDLRGGQKEFDTYTCKHCNKIVPVQPMAPPEAFGGHCRVCWGLICLECAKLGRCTPWEAQMEKIEARDRLRRAVEEWG